MNYFIYTYIISLLTGRFELNKLTSLPMCGFIAQLVEHRTGIAEVTGSNPVEALIFFRLLLSSCLNWKIHCEDHSSLSSISAVQKYMNYFIYTYIISLLTGRYELNKLTSLPMCGFIAQLVEHRTGIAEVTGSNPVEALIFFQASSFQLLKLENSLRGSFFTFIYIRSSKIYELFHIYLHHFTPHGKIWTQQIDLAPNVWLHSSVGRASHRYRGGHGFESRWSPDFFFQASSFQLLKLENSLRGSFFTFIYIRSSKIYELFHIYLHHFTPHGKIWTQQIDLAPNVWLHSSVGRASHRYRGGHGFESRWSPDFFFRLLLSSCLNWKIHCEDHSSLSSISAVQKYMKYFIYTYIISLLTGRYELNKLTSLPMCGFIAQLVEHRTGIAEVTGSNPVEALIFFQASSFQLLKLENSLRGSFFTLHYTFG